MNTFFILTLVSASLFAGYIATTCHFFGIPQAISNTYYLIGESKYPNLKYTFSIWMVLISGLLMPSWLEVTAGNPWQFLAFFTCAGLWFTAAAPNFKNVEPESKVHKISATLSGICGILWVLLGLGHWYSWVIIGLVLIGCGLGAHFTKTIKTAYTFWIEIWCFVAVYLGVILYWVLNWVG